MRHHGNNITGLAMTLKVTATGGMPAGGNGNSNIDRSFIFVRCVTVL